MKKYNITITISSVIILLVIQLFALSCNKEDIPESRLEMRDTLIYKKGEMVPFTGREKARVEDKIIEYDVVDGVRHGEFILYYESGNVEMKGQIEHNKNIGEWKYYYESGELESKGFFINDRPDGKWLWYYLSGNIKEEGSYSGGIRIGLWKQFDEQGIIIDQKEFSFDDSTSNDENYLNKFFNLK